MKRRNLCQNLHLTTSKSPVTNAGTLIHVKLASREEFPMYRYATQVALTMSIIAVIARFHSAYTVISHLIKERRMADV